MSLKNNKNTVRCYQLLVICILFYGYSEAQHPQAFHYYNLKASDAHGKVKTLESKVSLRPYEDYSRPYFFWAQSKIEYNKCGYAVKQGLKSGVNEPMDWIEIAYDSSGTILLYDYKMKGSDTLFMHKPIWVNKNEFWECDGRYIHKYDSTGVLREYEAKTVSGETDGYRHFFCDENGNTLKDISGESVEIGEYDYDSLGRLISERILYRDGSLIHRYDYAYNSAGLLVKTTFKSKNIDYVETLKYDSHQNVIMEKHTSSSSGSDYVLTYKYTYDSKGNWIEQTKFINGKDISKTTRKITYYTD